MFMNWIHTQKIFSDSLWNDFLVNLCEIYSFVDKNKIDLIREIVKNYIRDLIIYSISGNIINLDDAKKNKINYGKKQKIY